MPNRTLSDKLAEWNKTRSISLASEICDSLFVQYLGGDFEMDDIVERVIMWGEEKGLKDPKSQLNKVIEEVGEIAHEITRSRTTSAELYDAIGDTLVTIVILSDIIGIHPKEALYDAYCEIKDRKGKTVEGSFVKDE